jgi:hypothetical protein
VVTVMKVAMKFYNREEELDILEKIYNQSQNSYGKITVLTGRRRVGKTLLAKEFSKDKPSLYLFVSKKAEFLICEEFKNSFDIFTNKKYIGEIKKFSDFFELLLKYGEKKPFVVIIDEFQEFKNINNSIFSEIQKLWDEYKFKTKIHIIFIGSIYSLMINIFQNEKEPLYGRADRVLYIKPFKAKVIKEILSEYNNYNSENLFYNYLITGGVPRYQELLIESESYNKNDIIDLIFEKDSFFINEGKSLLIQEFGKDYGMYFSILELIASGNTSRPEIESILQKSVGGYLKNLEIQYDILKIIKPIGSKKDGRSQKYAIKDNFIKFWFRFVYKYISIIEEGRFSYIKKIIDRDLSTYAGPILEKLFIEIKGYSDNFGLIGTYWEKGNKNEIDIVAIDDFNKKIVLTEVKLNKGRIRIINLKEKGDKLRKKYSDYDFEYEGLSIDSINDML